MSFTCYLRIMIVVHFFHFWHSLQKMIFIRLVNFQVKFTPWNDVIAKVWCQNSPLEYYRGTIIGFAVVIWGSAKSDNLFDVLKLKFLRERDRYGRSPFLENDFLESRLSTRTLKIVRFSIHVQFFGTTPNP